MSGNRKKYTPEYREQAVRLVVYTGRSEADSPEVLDDDERAELLRLRKEDAELRLNRAFLKKAPSSPPNRTGREVPDRRSGEG